MKAPVLLLLASLLCFGSMPAGAQDQESEGVKVYGRRGVIYKSNLDGSEEQKLADGYGPALSPDHRHVTFTRGRNLYLLDLATMVEKILVEYDPDKANRDIEDPIWHPRGSTIFFNMVSLFLFDIYAVERDGTNFRLVVGGGGLYDWLSWPGPFSPDGHYLLLYTDCHDECETLRVVDLRTGNRVRLSERTSYGAWAPNGRLIAFGGGPDHDYGKVWPGLFVADPGGAQVRNGPGRRPGRRPLLVVRQPAHRLHPGERRRGDRRLGRHLRGRTGWHGPAVPGRPLRQVGAYARFHDGRRRDLREDLGTGQGRATIDSNHATGSRGFPG